MVLLTDKKQNGIKYTHSLLVFDTHNGKMVLNEKEQKLARKMF